MLDEIGLAPSLKVIHSELENMDKEEDGTIGFIGLSNWSLDAAQMNRGILLQRTVSDSFIAMLIELGPYVG